MPSTKPQIGLRLDEDMYQTIVALAAAERRPVANMAAVLIEGGLQEFLRTRRTEAAGPASKGTEVSTVADIQQARGHQSKPGPR